MSNISLTSVCNRNCPYCFTLSVYSGAGNESGHMPLSLFDRVLDYLERSNINQVSLLGGEPTLHPEFSLIVDRALDRGFDLLVFSNGLMPRKSIECLEEIVPEKLTVLLNATDQESLWPEDKKRVEETLERLGPRVMLGLNIYSTLVPLERLLQHISDFQLKPAIRLGLAHPCLSNAASGNNRYLAPRNYPLVGRNIVSYSSLLNEMGVGLEFDCGFVPCMFPDDAFELLALSVDNIGTRCNPILDILPDGSVISCFPLSGFGRGPLDPAWDADQLRKWFEQKLSPYRKVGIYPECSNCVLKQEGKCNGGCLAAAMKRLHNGPFHFEARDKVKARVVEQAEMHKDKKNKEGLPGRPQWAVPYIDQPASFWEEIAQRYGKDIREVYLPLPGSVVGSGRPVQPDSRVEEFLAHAPLDWSVLINPIVLPKTVEELAPDVISALKRLIDKKGFQGVTVSNLDLAKKIRAALPEISITASVLMDVFNPNQVFMLDGACDCLVPASRIMRNIPALSALRQAFTGRIRLIVNEACLPHCPFRMQHFFEMNDASIENPGSLCNSLLEQYQWMRLTGAWVLPQHLHLYDGTYDELKLAGRTTLQNPGRYFQVLDAYINRRPLAPDLIGGGPASVIESMKIDEEFFKKTLYCDRQCHNCTLCRDYYERQIEN